MAAGLPGNIGYVIQARLSSQRLPGKVLMDMPYGSGIPLLARIVDSVAEVAEWKNVVIATSELNVNDGIEDFCTRAQITCFRGSEEDVLSRFLTIASF
jgi:spore coat polysaccharide biosynthesis protein SpsF